jgi:hypothetical protein
MRRSTVFAIRTGYVLLISLVVVLVYPAFRRAKGKSGPTPRFIIASQLERIDEAKAILKDSQHRPDDYWPTRAEIASADLGRTNVSFEALIKPTRWGEVYFVNQIGAPAYAYLSNAVGIFPEGFLGTSQDFGDRAQPVGGANRSQPVPTETNSTSSAVGSRR